MLFTLLLTMKHKLLLLLLLLAAGRGRAQTLLQQESFETDGAGTRYTTNGFSVNTVGGTATQNRNQYFQRLTQTSPNADPPPNTLAGVGSAAASWYYLPIAGGKLEGAYFFGGEAVRGPANQLARDPGYVALNSVSIAGKTNLQVQVALVDGRGSYTNWYPNTATVRSTLSIQVNLDNKGWTTIGQFAPAGTSQSGTASGLLLDADFDGVGEGAQLTTSFQDFTFNVGSSGTSMQTRVLADVNGLSTEFGFDNIRVLGTTASGAAPVLSNLETTTLPYAEGAAPVSLTNTLTVNDSDSPQLSGGTVKFTSNGLFKPAEDRLLFTNQNGITGSYNTSAGMLTLSGAASPDAYQTALRAVQYQNADAANAAAGTRVISFQLTDNTGLASNTGTRTLSVTTALNAPTGLPYAEDLETDGEGTRYASNKTSGILNAGRFFDRTTTASEPGGQWHSNGSAATTISGITGSSYWWASGTSVLSNGVGTFTTQPINTAGYADLTFSVKLAASLNVWENAQYLRVAYRLGGSSGSWQPLLSFRSSDQTSGTNVASTTGNLRQDANPATTTGVPTGATLTPTLTTYAAALPAAANGQLVEFQINGLSISSDGVGEVLAFDNLQLTGKPTTTVTAITRASTNPTNAATVSYTVTFGAPVSGLTANNFSLTATGLSGAAVGTPVSTGAGSTWTVPVSTGSGSGTLTLNLANDTNLSVALTTALPVAGPAYTVDKTPPAAPIVVTPAAGSAQATVTPTYSGTSEANATVTVIVDEASIGTTVADGAGNWTLTQPAALAQGSHAVRATARDAAGNTSSSSATNTFTVDTTRPSVSISSSAGASGSTTTTTPLPFTITFSENVSGFAQSGLTVTGGTVSSFAGTGATYTFTVTPSASGSTVTVNVAAGVAQDQAGNVNTAAAPYSLTVGYPDLLISTSGQTVPAGTYNSITVQRGGVGTLAGNITVNGDVTIQSGGVLNDGCALISGAGSFTLAAGGTLGICSAQGISTTGATGTVQVTGTRSFSTDALYNYTGTVPQNTGSGLPPTVRALTLTNPAGLTLTADLTTTTAATCTSGVLSTGAKTLTLGTGATLSEDADSYVTGTVQATRTLATAGSPEAFGGLGLMLTPSGNTLPGSTLVRRVTGKTLTGTGTSTSIKRYFDIQPTVNTGLNVALVLTARDDERNGITPANLRLFKSEDQGASWQLQAATYSTATASGLTTYSASLSGVTDFSLWTLGDAAAPLPVTLTRFQAFLQDENYALLRWATASELHSAYFAVERSVDGRAFVEVGRVAAAGISPTEHTYELRDPLPPTGQTYYRLRQVDTDQTATYSPVVTLAPGTPLGRMVRVYPNPRSGQVATSVELLGFADQGLLIQVTDVFGRTVSTQQCTPTTSRAAVALRLPADLATGIYGINIIVGSQHWATRLLIAP